LRLLRRGRPPTDFELLKEIYERHRSDFRATADERSSKILVPIGILEIASHFGVDGRQHLRAPLLPP